jgi:hypothetical protein
MSMIREKIKLLQILHRRNIPSVLLKTVRRIFIKESPKVSVHEIDMGKMDMVFSSPAAQIIAELFDNSRPLEKADEIPIFGNPDMRLNLSDLMQRGWADIQPSGSVSLEASKDRRFFWELSRLQFLPLMARCISYSDAKAGHVLGEKLLGVIAAWRSANRFPLGINWESPLEVAVRLMNVLTAGAVLSKQDNLDDAIKHELSELFIESFGYLEDNLEYGDGLPSNHLIVEACVLFIASKALSMGEKAHRALRIIEKTLEDQISTGGILLESSLPYAVFVLEAYLLFALVYGMDEEIEVDQKLLNKVGVMYSSMVSLVGENLIVPSIGDDDSARVLRFDSLSSDEPLDRSYLAAIYDKAFSKQRELPQKRVGKMANKFLSEGLRPGDNPVLWVDEEAGFGSLSRGYLRVIFRFPGSREFRLGSHAHSDYLSFCLYFKDRGIFGDPGSFLYSDHDNRSIFRSEESHSTIALKDYPQRGYFKNPFISFANSRMGYDLDRAGDGFEIGLFFRERQGKYVRVERLFSIPDDQNVRITDFLHSDKTTLNLKWSFILSPYLRIEGIDETNQQMKSVHISGDGLKVTFNLPAIFDICVDEIRYSRYYGQAEPSKRISLIPEHDLVHPGAAGAPTPLSFEVHLGT